MLGLFIGIFGSKRGWLGVIVGVLASLCNMALMNAGSPPPDIEKFCSVIGIAALVMMIIAGIRGAARGG